MTHTRRMEGKRVLVTGSGTGIGRGVALEFAREGAAVVLHYAHSEAGAASAVDEIRSAGGTAEVFQADLADIEQVRALASQAIDFLGGLDVLVNNAGITMNKPFLRGDARTVRHALQREHPGHVLSDPGRRAHHDRAGERRRD